MESKAEGTEIGADGLMYIGDLALVRQFGLGILDADAKRVEAFEVALEFERIWQKYGKKETAYGSGTGAARGPRPSHR